MKCKKILREHCRFSVDTSNQWWGSEKCFLIKRTAIKKKACRRSDGNEAAQVQRSCGCVVLIIQSDGTGNSFCVQASCFLRLCPLSCTSLPKLQQHTHRTSIQWCTTESKGPRVKPRAEEEKQHGRMFGAKTALEDLLLSTFGDNVDTRTNSQ